METEEIQAAFADGVLTLTINRPEQRNAMNAAVIAGLSQHLLRAADDGQTRAIVITGAGERAFCAGADLQTGKSFQFDYSQPRAAFADLLRLARALNIPLIGRVNGACMAGGMGLLAVCDMAVAVEHALFGLPEVKVGVFPMQVLAVLQSLMPRRRLVELCITGEPMDAREALATGLVNKVVAPSELDHAVQDLVRQVVANSPAAIRRGKYALHAIESMSFEQAMVFMESQIGLLALTEDAKEGMTAFREKRKAQWTGR